MSLVQYEQALTFSFDTWHPPVMALIMGIFLRSGISLFGIMFLQCVSGYLSFYLLIQEIGHYLLQEDHLKPLKLNIYPVLLLLFFFTPLFPFIYYMMTLWKDVWFSIAFLGSIALILNIYRTMAVSRKGVLFLKAFFLSCFIAVAVLVRHNAIILLPLYALLIYFLFYTVGKKISLGLAIAPLLTMFTITMLISTLFPVKEGHPFKQIILHDLIGMRIVNRSISFDKSLLDGHLEEKYKERFIFGNTDSIMWDQQKIVDDFLLEDENFPLLMKEYSSTIIKYPLTFLKIKLLAFYRLLGVEDTFYWFHGTIDGNPYHFNLNERFASFRGWYISQSFKVYKTEFLRWISGVHLVWIICNLVLFIAAACGFLLKKEKKYLIGSGVLLLSLFYYASYLAATPHGDFRFMYPSTFFIQTVFFFILLDKIVSFFYKMQDNSFPFTNSTIFSPFL